MTHGTIEREFHVLRTLLNVSRLGRLRLAVALAAVVLVACDEQTTGLSQAEESWCLDNPSEVSPVLVEGFDPVSDALELAPSEVQSRWERLRSPENEEEMRDVLRFLEDEFPSEYGVVCRDAIAAHDVWRASYPGKRLLSDTTWIWCSDNRDSVKEVAEQLGLGSGELWMTEITPTEFYRACSTAAKVRGDIVARQPADVFVDTARVAGFLQSDEVIIEGGLEVCTRFDVEGVDGAMGTVLGTVLRVIGLPREGIDMAAAADIVIGAASVTICPEYAEEVASFG